MKKLILLLSIGLLLMACNTSDDGRVELVVGGDILLEYSHNINSLEESRHTFIDQGKKFDKVLNQIDEVLKEFIYQGDKISEIIVQVDDGTDHYFYEYVGDDIVSITIEETRNGNTNSVTEKYTYENNTITVNTPDDPPNLFRKKYTLNASGKVIELETYKRTGSDSYEWFDHQYEYDNTGRIESFDIDGGLYRPSDQAYFIDFNRSFFGGWTYFDDVESPFKNIPENGYRVILFSPELFNDGIFANGSLGLLENNFVSHYVVVNEDLNRPVEWELIRPQNILVQTNGLPKSGNVMFGFRPFEFTYAE